MSVNTLSMKSNAKMASQCIRAVLLQKKVYNDLLQSNIKKIPESIYKVYPMW